VKVQIPERMKTRLTGWIVEGRWLLLLGAVILTVIAWPLSQRLEFNQTLDSMFDVSDPMRLAYRESREAFGASEFIVLAYEEPNLFREGEIQLTEAAAERLNRFADRIGEVPGVDSDSILHLAKALEYRFRREKTLRLLEGMLVSDDHKIVAVLLKVLPEDRSQVPRAEVIADLRQIAASHDPPAYVVGEPVMLHDMFSYVEHDGNLQFQVSLGLLGLVTLILFRGVRWLLLPVLVVAGAMVWTRALLVLAGMQLSVLSSILNSLMTIIGVATVMHVIVQFGERARRESRDAAARTTIREIGPPVFWTCATTAAGFAALLSSKIEPVRSFGLMMTGGAMLVFVAVLLILPGGILIGPWNTIPGRSPREARLVQVMSRIAGWVERHPWIIGGTSLVLFVVTVSGLRWLTVQTDISENFRRSTLIVQSLQFVESRLGGAGTWEVDFPAPETLSAGYLERVESLTEQLRVLDVDGLEITKVLSLTDGLDLIPKFPFLLDTLERRLDVLRAFQPGFVSQLYNPQAKRMRILLRSREQLPAELKLKLIGRVQEVAQLEFPEAQVTGVYVLLARLVMNLMRDQWVSLLLATSGILVLMSVAFRSVSFGLISLVPNLFPIAIVVGGMGWVGLPVNIATAMLASVSMGLTVDGAIHYFAGFRRARKAGLDVSEALRETHKDVGRALLFATLALVVGFSVLTLSHFVPLIHFGVLVSVAMLGGLLATLFVLPLLLRLVAPKD